MVFNIKFEQANFEKQREKEQEAVGAGKADKQEILSAIASFVRTQPAITAFVNDTEDQKVLHSILYSICVHSDVKFIEHDLKTNVNNVFRAIEASIPELKNQILEKKLLNDEFIKQFKAQIRELEINPKDEQFCRNLGEKIFNIKCEGKTIIFNIKEKLKKDDLLSCTTSSINQGNKQVGRA